MNLQLLSDFVLVLSVSIVVLGSIGAIISRKAMHMVALLAVTALGAAAIIAILGYTYLAAFHIIVYAGAGITLMAIVLMFLGDIIEKPRISIEKALLALILALVIHIPLYTYVSARTSTTKPEMPSFEEVVSVFVDNWVYTIVIMITLAAVIIEAVAIARGLKPRRVVT